MKEVVMAQFKASSQHLPVGPEESHENLPGYSVAEPRFEPETYCLDYCRSC
jgi:hypothetical protein